jgi:hypothetical protein
MNEPTSDRPLRTADIASAKERQSEPREPAAHLDHGRDDSMLFLPDERERFRKRWSDVQSSFVDEPRKSVEQADTLVAETVQRLTQTFAAERAKLEETWSRGGDVSTEDLRCALQRYRTFFDRLLAV